MRHAMRALGKAMTLLLLLLLCFVIRSTWRRQTIGSVSSGSNRGKACT